MSSTTSHALLGDPKNGGALFLLPPEIRDSVYRFVVNDCYAVLPSRLYRHSISRADVSPNLSILRVSKAVCGEATRILYSESVFRFSIANIYTSIPVNGFVDDDDLDRVKRMAPMMKNVILDINGMSTAWAYYVLEPLMRHAIDIFGGRDIRRRSLRVRILDCTDWLEGRKMGNFCRQLKAFVGFSAAVVEVSSSLWLLRRSDYRALDDKERSERITDSVSRIMVAVAEQLEPSFGPAISGFKSKPGDAPVPSEKLLSLGDTVLVGYLKFHPGSISLRKISRRKIGMFLRDHEKHGFVEGLGSWGERSIDRSYSSQKPSAISFSTYPFCPSFYVARGDGWAEDLRPRPFSSAGSQFPGT